MVRVSQKPFEFAVILQIKRISICFGFQIRFQNVLMRNANVMRAAKQQMTITVNQFENVDLSRSFLPRTIA